MAKTSVPKERLEKAMEAAGFDLIGEGRRLQFTDGVGSKMFRNWGEVEEYLNSRIFPDQIQENVYRALEGKPLHDFAREERIRREREAEMKRRQDSVDWRMEKNKQVKSLTEEQHDALAKVCKMRHEMHAGQKAFFLSDDPRHSQFELFIGKNGKGEINRILTEAGLPSIKLDTDIFKVEADKDIKRENFDTDREFEMAKARAFDHSEQLAEAINAKIEKYLATIDKQHGTEYCPTGKFRYDKESHIHKTQRKLDRQEGIKPRIFVDMDGTLAKFNNQISSPEELYEEGYFRNLEPQQRVIDAVKEIIASGRFDVYIMSAVLPDSKFALDEKNEWLDKYIPEIPEDKRIFPPCGSDKLNYVPNGIKNTDVLLDDYTKNLKSWEPPAIGVKILNDINNSKGTWQGNKVSFNRDHKDIAKLIMHVADGRKQVHDEGREVGQSQRVQKFSKDFAENAEGIEGITIHVKGQVVDSTAEAFNTALNGIREPGDKMSIKSKDGTGRPKTAAVSINEIEMVTDKDNNILYESEDHKIERMLTFGREMMFGQDDNIDF